MSEPRMTIERPVEQALQGEREGTSTLGRRSRVHLVVALGLAAGLIGGGTAADGRAASARPQAIAPFVYEFRVVSFSMTAKLTFRNTAATIEYRLVKPSQARSLTYLGAKPRNPRGAGRLTTVAPIVDLVAEATYTSTDPMCTGTKIEYRPAGNQVQQVFVYLQPSIGKLRGVSAAVGRIPLAIPSPGEDSGVRDSGYPVPRCGKAKMGSWYQDMVANAHAGLISKPGLTITGSGKKRFTESGIDSLEWSLAVTLQRLKYRPIDCASHPGC